MVGARVGEAGHAELADAAQSLEFGGVEQAEQQRIDRPVQPEGDHVVHRVADDLLGHGSTIYYGASRHAGYNLSGH